MNSHSLSSPLGSRFSSPNSLAQSSPSCYVTVPPSPASAFNQPSPATSTISIDQEEDENATITIRQVTRPREPECVSITSRSRLLSSFASNLQSLCISIEELSYSISDIQARIFEIQEFRHKSQSSSDNVNTTSTIDKSLVAMDEKLSFVETGINSITETLDLPLNSSMITVPSSAGEFDDRAVISRKHTALLTEWETVQKEIQVLREELKEDKWLTVFRTVTDQADGMMSSLEKAVNRCQDFIWQVHRKGIGLTEDPHTMSQASLVSLGRTDNKGTTFEFFTLLLDSYEAKKKHYMPATSKVLAIIDKGVRERITKNGETLRRHAESAQRWRNLRERISRTDTEMENVRRIFLNGDTSSEAGSSTSGQLSLKNGHLITPNSAPRISRAPSAASTISESISPFRMIARKLTGVTRSVTPLSVTKMARMPSSEPPPNNKKIQRQSLFATARGARYSPTPPECPAHKYSQSLTPESSPQTLVRPETSKGKGPIKPQWNISTKVEPDDRSHVNKSTPPIRAPSAIGHHADRTLQGPAYRRSASRASVSSSRPWSPISSSLSTAQSNFPQPLVTPLPLALFDPPSRAQTPTRNLSPPAATTPRPRPRTPSSIPAPKGSRSVSTSAVEGLPIEHSTSLRAFSPTLSISGMDDSPVHLLRPPSQSKIPIPSLHFSTPSRSSTTMSNYVSPESPTGHLSFGSLAIRSQTPEIGARSARPSHAPVSGTPSGRRSSSKPPISRTSPSNLREGSTDQISRASSRAAAPVIPLETLIEGQSKFPMYEYKPVDLKDPLDVEVANVLNSLGHRFKVVRSQAPVRKSKSGEEVQAKYNFSTPSGTKIVNLKLMTVNRRGAPGSVKVVCRVGGGWQDLSDYVLNRQF